MDAQGRARERADRERRRERGRGVGRSIHSGTHLVVALARRNLKAVVAKLKVALGREREDGGMQGRDRGTGLQCGVPNSVRRNAGQRDATLSSARPPGVHAQAAASDGLAAAPNTARTHGESMAACAAAHAGGRALETSKNSSGKSGCPKRRAPSTNVSGSSSWAPCARASRSNLRTFRFFFSACSAAGARNMTMASGRAVLPLVDAKRAHHYPRRPYTRTRTIRLTGQIILQGNLFVFLIQKLSNFLSLRPKLHPEPTNF